MSVSKGNASKVLSKSFVENHQDICEDKAAELIVKAEQTIKSLKEEKNSDDKLAAAKEILRDLNAGYNSAINYEKAKINFLLEKINEIKEQDPDEVKENF